MSLVLPSNVRGPILDLVLPASEAPLGLILRNKTTGQTLTLNLPEDWDGTDLSLDFRRRTIRDSAGADRSALLSEIDNELWTPEPLITGANNVEFEAVGGLLVAKDNFNQTAGVVTAKALETGGSWEGELDTDDFSVVAGAQHLLRRSAKGDASFGKGRLIKASAPKPAAVRVAVDLNATTLSSAQLAGPHARCIAGGSRLGAELQWATGLTLFLILREGEAVKAILDETPNLAGLKAALDAGQTLRVALDCVGGVAKAYVGLKGALPTTPQITGTHEWLEGKGTKNLASGAVGLYDAVADPATTNVRNYDRFRAWDLAASASYAAKVTLRWEKGYY